MDTIEIRISERTHSVISESVQRFAQNNLKAKNIDVFLSEVAYIGGMCFSLSYEFEGVKNSITFATIASFVEFCKNAHINNATL